MGFCKGMIILINDNIPEWEGCLMVIDEVKSWGVLAEMVLPCKDGATTYLRVPYDSFVWTGGEIYE